MNTTPDILPEHVLAMLTPDGAGGYKRVYSSPYIEVSFMTALPTYTDAGHAGYIANRTSFSALNAVQIAQVKQMLSLIEKVSGVIFTYPTDPAPGGIRIGLVTLSSTSGQDTAGANIRSTQSGAPLYNDVYLGSLPRFVDGLREFGSLGYSTMLHEILHALGVEHTLPPGTLASSTTNVVKSSATSLMSYADYAPHGAGVYGMTPLVLDILALQRLYGPPLEATGTESPTTYTFLPDSTNALTISELLTIYKTQVKAIADMGGIDTLDASAYIDAVLIDLRPGYLSSIGGTKNIGIAFDTVIENATGGKGNDELVGNDTANTLKGGDGVDILNGLGGIDILEGGIGKDTLDGGDQDDTLDGGENDDTLKGGAGTDTYKFTGSWGKDTIIDSDGLGKIEIDGAVLPTSAARAIPQSGFQAWMFDTAAGTLILRAMPASDGSKTLVINKLVGGKVDSTNSITINNFDLTAVGALGEVDAALTQCKHTTTVKNHYKKSSCLRMYLKGCGPKRRKNLSAEEVRA